ncbi:hypothetical protein [Nitrosomonas supralitoralis]|nr:hypothetical protein [Nitrosomonas supralitoralis]
MNPCAYMANPNLHVRLLLDLNQEVDAQDRSALFRLGTQLTQAHAWDDLLKKITQQIQGTTSW